MLWSFLFWLFFLWSSAVVGYRWLGSDGLVSRPLTLFMTAWSAFFVGFICHLSASLHPRRRLLIGRLEPTADEWRALEPVRIGEAGSRGGLWSGCVLLGLALAAILGAVQLGLSCIGRLPGYPRPAYVFYTALLPAICVPPAVAWSARRSLKRFVRAMESGRTLQLRRRRYVIAHNVIPYCLFNAAAGLVVAFSRFMPYYLSGRPIPAHQISLHLAITAMVISLLVVGAARFKTRVDHLSPIVLTDGPARSLRARWRIGYALAAPFATYLALRLGFFLADAEQLDAQTAILLKVPVCLLLSLLTSYWAVTSVLERMEEVGLDRHPYVRFHRYLKATGRLG